MKSAHAMLSQSTDVLQMSEIQCIKGFLMVVSFWFLLVSFYFFFGIDNDNFFYKITDSFIGNHHLVIIL